MAFFTLKANDASVASTFTPDWNNAANLYYRAAGSLDPWFDASKTTPIDIDETGIEFKGDGIVTSKEKHFSMSGSIAASGDITSLTNEVGGDCTLVDSCYKSMFQGCAALTTAPTLPALTLSQYCYFSMFEGCAGLTEIPELPATSLNDYCYYRMFQDCSSIYGYIAQQAGFERTVQFPATFAISWNLSMFKNIGIGSTVPEDPASSTTYYFKGGTPPPPPPPAPPTPPTPVPPTPPTPPPAGQGVDYLSFNVPAGDGCSPTFTPAEVESLIKIQKGYADKGIKIFPYDRKSPDWTKKTVNGSATEVNMSLHFIAGSAEYSMDGGDTWTSYSSDSVITIPTDNSTIMWRGNGVKTKGTGFSITGGKVRCSGSISSLVDEKGTDPNTKIEDLSGLFKGCTALLSLPTLPSWVLGEGCYAQMFLNAKLPSIPVLPAKVMAKNCYKEMFKGSNISTTPELPAVILADNCYQGMFQDCTSLRTPPALNVEIMALQCYLYMFAGCTKLERCPALPATALANGCYGAMFHGCTSLTTAPSLPAVDYPTLCCSEMFKECSNLVTVPNILVQTGGLYCLGGMFEGCTSLKVYSTSGAGHDKSWRIPIGGTTTGTTSFPALFYGTQGDYTDADNVDINVEFFTQNTPV